MASGAPASSADAPRGSLDVATPLICSRRRWWLAIPPLRPASRASSLVHSWAVPFWWAALPPLLAMSRCFARSIDANPRSSFATLSSSPGSGAITSRAAGVPQAQPVQPECHVELGFDWILLIQRDLEAGTFSGNDAHSNAVPRHIPAVLASATRHSQSGGVTAHLFWENIC